MKLAKTIQSLPDADLLRVAAYRRARGLGGEESFAEQSFQLGVEITLREASPGRSRYDALLCEIVRLRRQLRRDKASRTSGPLSNFQDT